MIAENRETARATIAEIWALTLGVEAVAEGDNFFNLGGDSIMVTIMHMQVEEALGAMINPDLVFEHPSFGDFVAAVLKEG